MDSKIEVLQPAGHTPDSISLLVTDKARADEPQMLLTGDLLFAGDIGRPDLAGTKILDEQAENLYNSLTPRQFEAMVVGGAVIIDARDSAAFGGFHIPGSIHIGFEKQLANWVGMVVDPLVLVVHDQGDCDRMVTELHRTGCELIFGYPSGGIMAWPMSGRAAVRRKHCGVPALDTKAAAGCHRSWENGSTPSRPPL